MTDKSGQIIVDRLSSWMTKWRLRMNPAKCALPIFSKKNNGTNINQSGEYSNSNGSNSTSPITGTKAITGTNFWQDKRTNKLVYKQYIRLVLDYASPAWPSCISQTQHTSDNTKQGS
jgi:hypothetical protein